jgi:LacI family transcriptional regulator
LTEPPRSRPATLKDIATAIGVDISTASKVVNGGGISVRPETRKAILDEAARLNYRPHALARNLRTRRTGAIGVLLPDLTNPIYAATIRGAVRRAEELGYVTLVAEAQDDAASASIYSKLVAERRIDGFIIAVAAKRDLIAAIDAQPVPHVFVNRRASIGRSVTVDDEAAARLAARTLIEAGHKRLGFIGDSDEMDTARRRRAGFFGEAKKAGLPEVVDAVEPYSRRGGFDACLKLLAAKPRPTGIFASNLLVGISALAAARSVGVRVPEDLSMVTLDFEDANYSAPPLTAIAMPLDEMGTLAVEELHAMIEGREPKDVVVDVAPTLISRASVAPPPKRRKERGER